LLGAVYAHDGTLSLPLVFLLGWFGMVAGTSLDYALGAWGARTLLTRLGLSKRLEPRLDEAERHLQRRGLLTFLGAHFIGHVRSFVAITAGASGLPYRRFLLFEGIAALAWNLVFVGIGYIAGSNLETLQRLLSTGGLVIGSTVVVLYLAYRTVRRRGQHRHAPHTEAHVKT
jgi:membrane protein DedA with SNARE-associated domain